MRIGVKIYEVNLSHTMVENRKEHRCKYWATRSSVRSFARTAYSFACSGLLASLAPSAALTRSLARSLCSLPRSWDSELLMSHNDLILSHSVSCAEEAAMVRDIRRLVRLSCGSQEFGVLVAAEGDNVGADEERVDAIVEEADADVGENGVSEKGVEHGRCDAKWEVVDVKQERVDVKPEKDGVNQQKLSLKPKKVSWKQKIADLKEKMVGVNHDEVEVKVEEAYGEARSDSHAQPNSRAQPNLNGIIRIRHNDQKINHEHDHPSVLRQSLRRGESNSAYLRFTKRMIGANEDGFEHVLPLHNGKMCELSFECSKYGQRYLGVVKKGDQFRLQCSRKSISTEASTSAGICADSDTPSDTTAGAPSSAPSGAPPGPPLGTSPGDRSGVPTLRARHTSSSSSSSSSSSIHDQVDKYGAIFEMINTSEQDQTTRDHYIFRTFLSENHFLGVMRGSIEGNKPPIFVLDIVPGRYEDVKGNAQHQFQVREVRLRPSTFDLRPSTFDRTGTSSAERKKNRDDHDE